MAQEQVTTHPSPSLSPIVDANYRLQPADLQGASRRVVISNVTYQGIEEMTPVLHFEGQSKRLVLSPLQVAEVVEITGTLLFQQWIGVTILLIPDPNQSGGRILIGHDSPKHRTQQMPVYISEDNRGWRLALTVVGIILTLSILIATFGSSLLEEILDQARAYWLWR